jgi:hypothetical protein
VAVECEGRLEEARPGTGLGLAVASDVAALNGEHLMLYRGERLRGALAVLELLGLDARRPADGVP